MNVVHKTNNTIDKLLDEIEAQSKVIADSSLFMAKTITELIESINYIVELHHILQNSVYRNFADFYENASKIYPELFEVLKKNKFFRYYVLEMFKG